MSQYYNAQRSRNLFDPKAEKPFALSRTRIENFFSCKRCFYLDRRRGVAQPPGYPFNLNSAVDALLKKEFDVHRAQNSEHPLMAAYGLKGIVPFEHEKMDEWRENFKGVQYTDPETNLTITGAVDDIWINQSEELIVVDYKATSKNGEVGIDAPWQIAYKRQMEIYQWLLRKNGFTVSDTGYFVYCNGKTDAEAFDGKLEFDVVLLPYAGKTDWIEKALTDMRKTLESEKIPTSGTDCDFCAYRAAIAKHENKYGRAKNTSRRAKNS